MMASTLNRDEIAKLASDAGFKGDDIAIAVAVALAESGGNPRAHNTNASTGDNSYGLWQINMIGAMGPARRKQFNIKSNDDLFMPNINAHAAKAIHASGGWKAWTTYTSGAYKKHYQSMTPTMLDALKRIPGPVSGVAGVLDGANNTVANVAAANPFTRIPESINAFTRSLFKAVANYQAVVMALVFIIIGIVILLRAPLAKVIPQGKALKAVKAVSK